MKSNRTKIFILLSITLISLIAIKAKRDLTPLTFKPNAVTKQYRDPASSDPLTMDKIPYMDFLRMIAKYRDERQAVINNHFQGTGSGQYGTDFEDSRYYYISLQSLENYIAYIKQEIQTNSLNVNFSGIRIYPIVYTNSGSSAYYTSIPSVYRNHQSIAFTATYTDESGYAIDFDPDLYTTNSSGNFPKSLMKQDTQSVTAFMSSVFSGTAHAEYSAQDHAWLCPPPRPCTKAAALDNADNICPDNILCPY